MFIRPSYSRFLSIFVFVLNCNRRVTNVSMMMTMMMMMMSL